ncbi:MAG: UvrD-helicase domain-containing protein [Candidatus Omnitrophota bacterium]
MTAQHPFFQFPEVRVVEASAGSGKTFALAKRYVQLLLLPYPATSIRQILAITFTRKAAIEMKARILDFLKRIALQRLSSGEADQILSPLGLSAEDAAARAGTALNDIICRYNYFQVQTIDSFINAILSGCAFKIGLSSRFRIRHNALDYWQYSLDKAIERAMRDPEGRQLFEQFLRQYLLLENKGGWFPKKDILGLIFALYQQANVYAKEYRRYPGDDDVLDLMIRVRGQMQEFYDRGGEGLDGRFRNSLQKFFSEYSGPFDFDRVSRYWQRPIPPFKRGADAPPEAEHLWENIQSGLGKIAETEAYGRFNPYIDLYELTRALFEQKAMDEDVLFLEELNRRAGRLFDDHMVTVEELYFRLATRFRHYLVDEFQDTSVLQWKNLYLMVEEALSTGGSLFYVGDKKQAIYSFRGGESRLFDAVQSAFRSYNVQKERLPRNYRSYQQVVEFNNQIFDMDNIRRFLLDKQNYDSEKKRDFQVEVQDEDWQRLQTIFGGAEQEALPGKSGGMVRVTYVDAVNKTERDEVIQERLLDRVGELSSRFSLRDIAVLTRKNSEVEDVTAWLTEAGYSVESERTVNIKEDPLIQEIVSFLRFLDSPINDLAFVEALTGRLFSRVSGRSPQDVAGIFFRAHAEKKKGIYKYKIFQQTCPDLWTQHIEPFFRQAGSYPLYEFIVSILRSWNVFEHFPDRQGFFMQFLELVKAHEEDGPDLKSFLEFYERNQHEDVFVNVEGSDSIRVLTGHKAKGLEFPVVIIPFLTMDIQTGYRGGADPQLGQQSFLLNNDEEDMELLRIKNSYLPYSDHLYRIKRRQYLEALYAELDAVYVALTRAEQEMYIFLPDRAGKSFNIARFLIPEEFFSMGQPAEKAVSAEERKWEPVMLSSCPSRDWVGFLKEEFGRESGLWQSLSARRFGQMAHEVLARVGVLCEVNRDRGIAEAVASVKAVHPSGPWDRVESAVRAVVADPVTGRFFCDHEAEVKCEYDLVDRRGRTWRVDRLLLGRDMVRVIDFKSGQPQEKHHDQVREYMALLAEIYPGMAVEGFVLYFEGPTAEQVEAS